MLALSILALLLVLLPALLAGVNLTLLRTPDPDPGRTPLVSILIPARNEAGNIAATVQAALASAGTPVEVIVGDDHSTDATASIVRGLAANEPRLRLLSMPPLPEGWTGKNHALSRLAAEARGACLLFLDADVRLEPNAAAGLAAHAQRTGASLVSGVPRQRMVSLGERITVPMINFLLVGFLPVAMMRASLRPALGAACGQLVLVERAAYLAAGGHAAIRTTLHDGVRLPRLLRAAGYRTDLVAGHALATCRMYGSFAEAWAGFSKNAHEGMATRWALPVWTLLLAGGQILPWLLVLAGLLGLGSGSALFLAAAAAIVSLATRAAITLVADEPPATILLHPAAVAVALAIQWNALLRPRAAGTTAWKGRSYPIKSG